MVTTPLTDLRERIGEVIDEIRTTGTECIITKHGRPVAVLLSHDEYEAIIETLNVLSDSDTMDAIAEARSEFAEDDDGATRA